MADPEQEITRGELLDFLHGKIAEEFSLARDTRPSAAREACFHRIVAYCDVLALFDSEEAQRIRIRAIEEH